jgi:polysaccharide pyruvyl transferase WcaK-like protein
VQFFVGIKLHAVALAMCTNVPSLMIEYRPKCREFATTLGVERFCVRSDSLDVAQMLALISVLQDQGREVSRTMHARATIVRDRIQELSKAILSSNGW